MAGDRVNQTITLEDGRQLGFAEWGAPSGRPVFHFHGAASSRLERPTPEDVLLQADVRLVTVDRPGHGLSDWQPKRRLLDWPEDVRQLADHLGLGTFYVEGCSAGGPHALACAHQLPGRVLGGAAISSVAPMSRPGAFEGLPLPNRMLAKAGQRAPWLVGLIRWLMRRMVMGDAEKTARQLMASIPEADKEILYAAQNKEVFVASVREGFRPGWHGAAHDDVLTNREWGFDLGGIEARIDIWHGEADVNVPVHAATYLRDAIPHTRVTLLPGAGHFLIFERWGEILAALVSG